MSIHSAWLQDHLPPGEGDDVATLVPAILVGLRAARDAPDALVEARPFAGALKHALGRKVRLDDSAWCELVRILFNLSTRPLDADAQLGEQTRCILLCGALLGKRDSGHAASGGGLELPWRPLLAALLRWHMSPRHRPFANRLLAGSTVRKHGGALALLMAAAREHFPPGCAPEIVCALEPLLCPLSSSFGFGSYALALLTPSRERLAGSALLVVQTAVGVVVYADVSSELLRNCFDTLARVAKSAFVGRVEKVDWSGHMPMIYTRTLSALGVAAVLDEGALAVLQSSSRLIAPEASVLSTAFPVLSLTKRAARLIVLDIDGSASPAEALARLLQLLRAVETFCHPSNDGWWVVRLGHFLLSLTKALDWRLHWEAAAAAAGTPTVFPPLSAAHAEAMLDALLPLVLNGVHSKNMMMRAFARKALHHLTYVRATRVSHALVEHALAALTEQTAVHQAESMLHVLARLVPELVRARPSALAEGAADWEFPDERVSLLLELVLPAIDASTGGKSKAALSLVHGLLLHLPLAASDWADDGTSRAPAGLALADGAALAACGPLLLDAGADARARALADGLPAWSLAVLERLLVSAEAAADEGSSPLGSASGEARSMGLQIAGAFDATHPAVPLAFQASERTLERMLQRVCAFAESSILPRSGLAELAPIVGALARAAPAKALGLLLPLAMERLVERPLPPKRPRPDADGVAAGAAAAPQADVRLAPQSRRSLAHWLSVVAMSLVGTGTLGRLLALARTHAHAEVASLTGHALHTALHALCHTYLLEERSHAPALWHAPEFRRAHWRYWGAVAAVADARLDPAAHAAELARPRTPLAPQWHVPSEGEVAAAVRLATEALDFAEAELRTCGVLAPAADAAADTDAGGAPAAGGAAAASVDQRAQCALLQLQAVIGGVAVVAAERALSAEDEAEAAAMELEAKLGDDDAGADAAGDGEAAAGDGDGAFWRELRAKLPKPHACLLRDAGAMAVRERARALALAVADRLAPASSFDAPDASPLGAKGAANGGASKLATFVRTALVLARCLGALLTDRGGTVLGKLDKQQATARQRLEIRGAGRQRARPRFVHLQRLKGLHNATLLAASHERAGGGGRAQQRLLGALCHLASHVSPEVRATALRHASDGAKRCARSAVSARLRAAIDAVGDPLAFFAPPAVGDAASAQVRVALQRRHGLLPAATPSVPAKHEAEGAIAMLGSRHFSLVVGGDWRLLGALLCALQAPHAHAAEDADALRLQLKELGSVYARLTSPAQPPDRAHRRHSRRLGASAYASARAALLRAAAAATATAVATTGGGASAAAPAASRAQTALFALALTLCPAKDGAPGGDGGGGGGEEKGALETVLLSSLASPVKACRTGAAAALCRLLTRDAADADFPESADANASRLRGAAPPSAFAEAGTEPRGSWEDSGWACWLAAEPRALPPPARPRARPALRAESLAAVRAPTFVPSVLSWMSADHREGSEGPSKVEVMMEVMLLLLSLSTLFLSL
ncbi:hypothetical protein T492DRAFT_887214 [Pavlovales sp. CCMP2436]|nr:hypothetical protein T492DRAFT_887214 [Pavlovales sp. CCMP2436]